MTKKGKVSEILSKALYNDNPELYTIGYTDLQEIREVSLPDFLKISENFEIIPASRITYIKKNNNILYSKL